MRTIFQTLCVLLALSVLTALGMAARTIATSGPPPFSGTSGVFEGYDLPL